MTKAIILFSGGLDSTVMLALALEQKRDCHCLSFNYGQKHKIELEHAKAIAAHYRVPHRIITIDPSAFETTSLVSNISVPKYASAKEASETGVTSTYVPARNTLFLSYALGQAEILGADEIYFGPNAMDYASYIDCRPAFIEAFQHLAAHAINSTAPKIVTPLIHWTKEEIVKKGKELNAPLKMTFSCYDPTPDHKPCGSCQACQLRPVLG